MSPAASGTRSTRKPSTANGSRKAAGGSSRSKRAKQTMAKRWTCGECGVSIGRMDGTQVPLPESWTTSREGTFCLLCRRERAARAALDAAPADCGLEEKAKLRRAALIEFEVLRRPEEGDGMIAKTCRSSVAAVAAARRRLNVPTPPPPRR